MVSLPYLSPLNLNLNADREYTLSILLKIAPPEYRYFYLRKKESETQKTNVIMEYIKNPNAFILKKPSCCLGWLNPMLFVKKRKLLHRYKSWRNNTTLEKKNAYLQTIETEKIEYENIWSRIRKNSISIRIEQNHREYYAEKHNECIKESRAEMEKYDKSSVEEFHQNLYRPVVSIDNNDNNSYKSYDANKYNQQAREYNNWAEQQNYYSKINNLGWSHGYQAYY